MRFLARLFERDLRTVFGSTFHYLTKQCNIKESNLDELSSQLVKKSLVFEDIPPDRQWTCQIATELMSVKNCNSKLQVPGFSTDEIGMMLDFACTY